MAHIIDLFLLQDATTAIIEPRPMPPSMALLATLLLSPSANSGLAIAIKARVNRMV